MLEKLWDKLFPVKLFGIACRPLVKGRGRCFLTFKGRFFMFSKPQEFLYEFNSKGTPTVNFEKIIEVMKNKINEWESYKG